MLIKRPKTMVIEEEIKNRLDKLKFHPRETYNEVISRLIKNTEGNK